MEFSALTGAQRAFFETGATRDPAFRRRALRTLAAALRARETTLCEALRRDLGKSDFEGYMCEIGLVLDDLAYLEKHLDAWSKPRRVKTPLAQFYSRSFRLPAPKGCVLVMSPWNYPLMLSLEPLVGALAAGCCVVLKPSAYAPATSRALQELLAACFAPEYVAVVEGGRAENAALLEEPFDHIFFTGSVAVGKLVMEKAAAHLCPVTLELGGKSPCIVERTANLDVAARRIAFGKFLNCGQTCVAPDYILCDAAVKDALLAKLKAAVAAQYGARPLENPDYGKIVTQKHFDRLKGLLTGAETAYGGGADAAQLRIEPTILDNVTPESPVMQEEIFGPVLPILTYQTLDEAIRFVNARPHPLALYLFTQSKAAQRRVLNACQFGGGCVNDTVIHLATSHMPFGGVGASGMGAYHGKDSFDTFTHYKSIVDKATWLDLPIRYQPYTAAKEKLLRLFLK